MFFRFGIALILIVLISLAATALESGNLSLYREISRQHYRLNVLLEQENRLRLQAERLAAPVRTIQSLQSEKMDLSGTDLPLKAGAGSHPLSRWRQPRAGTSVKSADGDWVAPRSSATSVSR